MCSVGNNTSFASLHSNARDYWSEWMSLCVKEREDDVSLVDYGTMSEFGGLWKHHNTPALY